MTGLEMLTRARELAYRHEKESGQHGTATMLFDLINEIERLREAARGSAAIVNQALATSDKAIKDATDAEAQVVALSIDKGRLRKALKPFAKIAPCVEYTDKRDGNVVHRQRVIEDGKHAGFMALTKDDFRRAAAAFEEAAGSETPPTTFGQFHNAIRVLWNIDRPDWMPIGEWIAFSAFPHAYFVRADDETARKLWGLIEPRLRP